MLIDWSVVIEHCPNITGIIHAGGHTGEEAKVYGDIPCKWVECDPILAQGLRDKGLDVYEFAASDKAGFVNFNQAYFRATSSLLKPNLNAKRRADTATENVITVYGDTIRGIQEPKYNMLNLDIQGFELNALRGTDLTQIDYVYTEIHKDVETYYECAQLWEIQEYLTDFVMVEIALTKYMWGDAVFVRKSLIDNHE